MRQHGEVIHLAMPVTEGEFHVRLIDRARRGQLEVDVDGMRIEQTLGGHLIELLRVLGALAQPQRADRLQAFGGDQVQ